MISDKTLFDVYKLNQDYNFLEVLSDQMSIVTENDTHQLIQLISTIKNSILPSNPSNKFSNLLENNQPDNRVKSTDAESKYKNILTVVLTIFLKLKLKLCILLFLQI